MVDRGALLELVSMRLLCELCSLVYHCVPVLPFAKQDGVGLKKVDLTVR